jgi:flagellum-specific peptidoglycan hydrolase FlgJ
MKALLTALLLFCCGLAFSQSAEAYIAQYHSLAIREMKNTGIPASITLAQALLESGNGTSRLAKKAKNHFGIKCTASWKGKTFRQDDDKKDECFRRYRRVKQSYEDHSKFLQRDRYAVLFRLDPTDYKAWAEGLQKAGYATNKSYASLLIRVIEKHELQRFDKKMPKKYIRHYRRENRVVSK